MHTGCEGGARSGFVVAAAAWLACRTRPRLTVRRRRKMAEERTALKRRKVPGCQATVARYSQPYTGFAANGIIACPTTRHVLLPSARSWINTAFFASAVAIRLFVSIQS